MLKQNKPSNICVLVENKILDDVIVVAWLLCSQCARSQAVLSEKLSESLTGNEPVTF